MITDVGRAVQASSLGELCWVGPDGRPQVRGVVALVRDTRPAIAFTYADEEVAHQVAAGAGVALALTEPRATSTAFTPVVLHGTPRLAEDPSGDVYLTDLVTQELRRYPPSRLLADSPLLMREHWWYLPRLVVELDVDVAEPLPARAGDHDHLLVVADHGVPAVRVAGILAGHGDRLELDVQGAAVPPGPAELFGQDASFPDLESWSQWHYRGDWDGTALQVVESPAHTGLGSPPGLLRRWRRQRALERACVAAIPPR